MKKMLVDMFVKQQGSYKRLIEIAKFNYPEMKIKKFETVSMPTESETRKMINVPVLILHFYTN